MVSIEKSEILALKLLVAHWSGLESMGKKSSLFSQKMAEKNRPHSKRRKQQKMLYVHTKLFFASRTVVALRIHPKTSEAYFTKWTTTGEPPVSSRSPWDS